MSAKNITSEKMNTGGFSSGGGAAASPRRGVLTPQPQNQRAKGPPASNMAKPKKTGTGKPG